MRLVTRVYAAPYHVFNKESRSLMDTFLNESPAPNFLVESLTPVTSLNVHQNRIAAADLCEVVM
jgi:hypothetical protein